MPVEMLLVTTAIGKGITYNKEKTTFLNKVLSFI
jgi:hypothetical protein